MEKKGRSTVYNQDLATDEKFAPVNQENKDLMQDFFEYLRSANKSPKTINQYNLQLRVFFIWNLERNNNKRFADMKKRDFIRFFSYLEKDLKASNNRRASFKGVLSSLSAFIETILDDEYPDFHNLMGSFTMMSRTPVREKTVLSDDRVEWLLGELVRNKKYNIACYLALLLSSGMRRSEALQMKVEDFTVNPKIAMGCMYETSKIRTKGRGKEGKVISRLIFKDTFDPYLKLWLKQREELGIECPSLFVRYKNGKYIPAQDGTFNSWNKKITDMLGEPFYPHCMRHYFVTTLKRKGYPDDIIQKIVKWSTVVMVGVYIDLGEEEELTSFFGKVSEGEIELKDEGAKADEIDFGSLIELGEEERSKAEEEKRLARALYQKERRAALKAEKQKLKDQEKARESEENKGDEKE